MTMKPSPKDEKPAPEPEPAAQTKPAARDMKRGLGGGGGFIWALLALAVVAGAGAATVGVWMPKLAKIITAYQAPPVDPRLAPVVDRVQVLENEQKAQAQEKAREASLAAARTPPPSADDIKEIVSRLTKMETRLAALRKMVGATRSPETARTAVQSLQRLSGRLQSLEQNRKEVDVILKRIAATDRSLPGDGKENPAPETVTGGRELVAATRKLNRRIKSDKPFADVLAQVKRLAAADKADRDMAVNIAALEPLAPSGVRTMDQLRGEFTTVAAAIRRAKPLPSEPLRAGKGWWDKTLNKLAAMVSLRRQGEKDAALESAWPQLVAAAEKALSENSGENNIAAAISALEGLSGRRLAVAAAWLERARGRETAKKAAAALNLFALSRLAGLVAAAKLPEKAAPKKAKE
ncbi:MAG TPA: hypothetical protein ENI55_06450 [Alphaproteobacteria bacterium]|nr:hypothetical protein [Alphaproteobacteria bacterium]